MAQPRIDEVRFQGYAKTQEYKPLEVPDPNPLLSEKLNTITRSFGNLQQGAEMNFLAREAERQEREDTRARLIDFSQTLLGEAVKAKVKKDQNDMAEGAMLAKRNFLQRERSIEVQEQGEAQINAVDNQASAASAAAAASGADYDVIQGLSDLSGKKLYGAYVQASKLAGQNSGNYFLEQLRSNQTQLFIDGVAFKISEAGTNTALPLHVRKAQVSSAIAQLEKQYLIDSGLLKVSEGMRNKYAQDAIDLAAAQVYKSRVDEIEIGDSESKMQINDINMMESYKTDPGSVFRWINTALGLKDSDGNYRTRGGMKKYLKQLVKEEAGRGNNMDIDALFANTVDGTPDGQTYAARFPQDLRELKETVREERNTQDKSIRESNSNYFKNTVTMAYNKLRNGEMSPTIANVDKLIADITEKGRQAGVPVDVTVLERFRESQTFTGAALEAIRQDLRALQDIGMLDSADPRLDNPLLRAEFGAKAEEQTELRTDGKLKDYYKAIDGFAKTAIDAGTEENEGDAVLIVAELQRRFEDKYTEAVALDTDKRISKAQHAHNAFINVTTDFSSALNDKTSRYYRNSAGDFSNFRNVGEALKAQRATNAVLQKVNNAYMTQNGLEAFKTDSSLMGGKEAILAAQEQWNRTASLPGNYTAVANYLNDKYGAQKVTPMQLLFLASEGIGQPVEGSAAIIQRYRESSPSVQGLVDKLLMQQGFNPNSHFRGTVSTARPAFESVRGSISPGMKGLGELVRSGEGTYTSMFPSENYPELTNMTIRTELVNFQKSKLRDGRKSAAVGAYQFLYPEVAADRAGLPADAKFTPENQEKMFIATIMSKPGRQNLARYLQGKSNDVEKAIDELAMEFASIEYRNGRSYYHSDGVNRAKVTRARARAALLSARQQMMGRNS
jgi:nucleoside phosphorylase